MFVLVWAYRAGDVSFDLYLVLWFCCFMIRCVGFVAGFTSVLCLGVCF